MNDAMLDRDLLDLFRAGPQTAPSATVVRALARTSALDQRRPRFALVDARAWPPRRGSLSDPAVHRMARLAAAALLIVLAATIVAVGARLLDRSPAVTVTAAGTFDASFSDARGFLLPDGRVLVRGTGGTGGTWFFFDPRSGQTARATRMPNGASSVDVLPDGRVVVIASEDSTNSATPVSIGLVDVDTGELAVSGELLLDRFAEAVLVLHDGRVLIAGGADLGTPEPRYFATVQLFDPAAGTTTNLPPLLEPRMLHSLTELGDGRILVTGGVSDPSPIGDVVGVEVYELDSGTSRTVGRLTPGWGPSWSPPVRLADGRILIRAGRVLEEPCPSSVPPSGMPPGSASRHAMIRQPTFVFDPRTDSLTPGPVLPHPAEMLVALADGRALAAGQYAATPGGCASNADAFLTPWLGVVDVDAKRVFESYNPATGTHDLLLDLDRRYAAGVLLPDGRVALITGVDDRSTQNEVDLVTIGR